MIFLFLRVQCLSGKRFAKAGLELPLLSAALAILLLLWTSNSLFVFFEFSVFLLNGLLSQV